MKQPGDFPIPALLFNFRCRKSALVSVLLCLVLVAGLYASLNIMALFLGVEDPDSLHSLMLWQGVNDQGLSWLADWRYTQDNWLLSLVPLHFLGFLLFGPSHTLIVVSGWLIFLASALVSAAIAWSIGSRRASLFILLLLLNFGMYAHVYGFVSYSTSHNITNLFGLLSVLLLVRWYRKPRSYHLILLLLVLVCGAISDPWMLPAFNLPILLMGVLFLWKAGPGSARSRSLKLILVSGLSIIAVQTKLLGLLYFLPDVQFALADWPTMLINLEYVVRATGGILNLVPYSPMNDLLAGLGSLTALIALLVHGMLAYFFPHVRKNSNHALFAFLLVAFFSVGGTAMAAIVSAVEANDNAARFLINIAYLLIIALAILIEMNWESSAKAIRSSAATLFGLFVVSSFISASNLISFYEGVVTPQVEPIISRLRINQLEYGYGSYWDPAPANSITAASDFAIRVRPVTFNSTSCQIEFERAESSRRWYLDRDIPAGTDEFFVMMDVNQLQCGSGSNFPDGLTSQFGKPVRSIEFGEVRIFVWDHKLLGFVPPLTITPPQTIDFNVSGETPNGEGWSSSESWGTWSIEDTAEIHFDLSDYSGDYLEMEVTARAFLPNDGEPRTVQVIANGSPIGQLSYDFPPSTISQSLRLPTAIIDQADGNLLIGFSMSDLKSPAELGISEDTRRLGIGLVSVSFK